MTVMLPVLSALGLAAIVAVVAAGFWHRRQLDADMRGHAEHTAGRWGPDVMPFTVRGDRAEQDGTRGEGSDGDGEFAGGPDTD